MRAEEPDLARPNHHPAMSLLELKNIEKAFGANRVLQGVSLELDSGEVHALVGANGAGKSTLIKILSGAYTRDSGEILIDGRPVQIRNPQEGLAHGIGVIYQEFNLVPELSVAENVLLGQEPVRRLAGLPLLSRGGMLAEARAHLEELRLPLEVDRPVKELTTGEKQLVEIAKALYRKARVLVLDEPTAALSRGEAEQLFRIMESLQQRGIGMIYISHHLEEVFRMGDRITVLRDGRNIATWTRGSVTERDLVQAMVGREVEEGERAAAQLGDTVLETERLTGDVFRDVSLQVRRGEVLSLTGAAGAGQTELLWALYGAAPVREGTLRLRGEPVRWRSLRQARSAGVALAPGDRKAYGIVPGQTIRTNLTFADLGRWTRAGVLQRGALQRASEELIRRYGVRCTGPEQEIQNLSGGNQQKVVVSRVAERGADLYLFDEPTRGVDVGAREEIYAMIHSLAAGGAGVIVATPDIQEALRLGDRVGVLRQGRLVYEEPRERAAEPEILAAILGAESGGVERVETVEGEATGA
ncbi:MAG: sugar ABC transporter ATP-binding protein [Armatimonadota bacterium]